MCAKHLVKDREAWSTAAPGTAESDMVERLSNDNSGNSTTHFVDMDFYFLQEMWETSCLATWVQVGEREVAPCWRLGPDLLSGSVQTIHLLRVCFVST